MQRDIQTYVTDIRRHGHDTTRLIWALIAILTGGFGQKLPDRYLEICFLLIWASSVHVLRSGLTAMACSRFSSSVTMGWSSSNDSKLSSLSCWAVFIVSMPPSDLAFWDWACFCLFASSSSISAKSSACSSQGRTSLHAPTACCTCTHCKLTWRSQISRYSPLILNLIWSLVCLCWHPNSQISYWRPIFI